LVSLTEPLRGDPADPMTLRAALEVAMQDVSARGLSVSGALPVVVAEMGALVPEDAAPLTVNGGQLKLGATRVSRQEDGSMPLELPEGQLATDISLNPVAMEFLGKFVNPVFVDPE